MLVIQNEPWMSTLPASSWTEWIPLFSTTLAKILFSLHHSSLTWLSLLVYIFASFFLKVPQKSPWIMCKSHILCYVLPTELMTRVTYKTSESGDDWESFNTVLSYLSYMIKAPMVTKGTPIVNALMKQQRWVIKFCIQLVVFNVSLRIFCWYIYGRWFSLQHTDALPTFCVR